MSLSIRLKVYPERGAGKFVGAMLRSKNRPVFHYTDHCGRLAGSTSSCKTEKPRGSTYTTIMVLGPQSHNGDGLLGPNFLIVVYMDPLGNM